MTNQVPKVTTAQRLEAWKASIAFADLEEVEPRVAWPYEAHAFTPWLATNLDRLGKSLGLTLELESQEVSVGRYAADILARNISDGSAVLIENQLEWSDHTHLGQILTYLTGLKAKIVIWVAPNFRPEHISALHWLNENTVEPFAFFAVKIRAVRIGQSPFAPLFEVVERPNDWDRKVQELAREAQLSSEGNPFSKTRRAFWSKFTERFPDTIGETLKAGGASRWRAVPGSDFIVSQWFAKESVGVFVRGREGVSNAVTLDLLAPHAAMLKESLGLDLKNADYLLLRRYDAVTSDESRWTELAEWLHAEADRYVAAMSAISSGNELGPQSAA